jgi:hypothetical protein
MSEVYKTPVLRTDTDLDTLSVASRSKLVNATEEYKDTVLISTT